MTKAPTQKEYYNGLIAFLNGEETSFTSEDFIDFCKGRIAVLDKKAENKKATKTQEANEELKNVVAEVLKGMSEPATVSEIMAKDERLSALSNQKVSAILRLMCTDDVVVKTTDKKKSLFALA